MIGLFFAARIMGGAMGDYGGGTPAEVAQHNREMNEWFLTSFLGFGACVGLAFWWSAGARQRN